ncbi:type II CRISPR RNA-guided endonuclease Cas9 [Bythopirellula goksoeyrii]|uniref:CRISPR-associated endonuclease Cas9 n=1 Tax=Bythopirellula goksoeyrii TaxID=1400387 RepID=A0A5B9QAA6_9BACT|nr:type II CRISPR RNA-guided endonuclease Cas9 [Bythopirellula goksoeyrii]QEG35994.1 CRISPR-associated endonuclease Cas9/Csn1 [Bythopirellula goksoeyrii]
MSKVVLGLDVGPRSIGWALINDDPKTPNDSKIIDLGVRVFPEGVDAFDTFKEVSRSEQRRIARRRRRQQRRRANRRRMLKGTLLELDCWPTDESEQESLYQLDPYVLRSKALDEQLTLHEIGRVLLHLNQRRGFKSNKKEQAKAEAKAKRKQPENTNVPDADKKPEDLLLEMQELEQAIKDSTARTLGEYLCKKQLAFDHAVRIEDDHIRGRHTLRKMLMDEFDQIWNKQAQYYPLFTEQLRDGKVGRQRDIHKPLPKDRVFLDKQGTVKNPRFEMSDLEAFGLFGLIFFHRTLKPVPKEIVGLCELEPKQRRCARADRRAQYFRLLQEVNNLRYIDPDLNQEGKLSDSQRKLLLKYLETREKATFDEIRKTLGLMESITFNLERGNKSHLKGMTTDWLIAKSYGKDWHELPGEIKSGVVEILINSVDEEATHQILTNRFSFTAHQADAIQAVDLPEGYSKLSVMAIEKLRPFLEQGMVYMAEDVKNSALQAAGYFRRDQLQRRLFDKLPDPRRTASSPIGDIPNPVVKRTLTEIRKVVNAIIRVYGKPDVVHLEMARSLKMSAEKRKEYNKRIRDRENARNTVAETLRENGARPSHESILRYLLWEAQNQECVYSGKPISLNQLLGDGGGVEIDHLLPYQRTLDDSQANKVVCFRTSHADKGNRSPYEWLAGSDKDKYRAICQRAKQLVYPKYRRFLQKELQLDHFIARQLTDTSYITKATAEYLQCLFEKEHAVLGLKGQLTSELRWQWGLETVIEELPDSPAWHESANLRPGEKNRADHRHHAIDAVVLALTTRSRLQKLSQLVKSGGAKKHGETLADPWENFRDDVLQHIKQVNVSHRVDRKVRGALHEETLYGRTQTRGEWVVRKPLENLSANEIEKIRDETIRNLVMVQLKEHGVEFGRGKKPDRKKLKAALANMTMPSGVPIKKVRILRSEQTIRPLRGGESVAYVKPGSMHHLCLFEWEEKGKKKREAVFVSMLEAIDRLKSKQQIIQRTPSVNHETIPAEARFIMSLASREMVVVNENDEQRLLTFQTAASTIGQMRFIAHNDARKSKNLSLINFSASTLSGRKVTVDPLGRIRWAND